jgi:cyclic pyranopterin phosphate synthase
MPPQGLDWLPKEDLLTFEELARLVRIFLRLGVRSIKVTGGEPTVRSDLPTLVRMFREAAPRTDISMTTNGLLLEQLAAPLAEAGLDRVTVSLDSLLRARYRRTTHRDALERVLAGIRAAADAGLTPVKVNCVVISGQNDDEVVDFARWSRETGHVVRFIEYMPLDALRAWERVRVVPSALILDAIGAVYPLVPVGADDEPARSYRFADGAPGGVGVIPAVTSPFCRECNRLRLTAEGQVRACLFALEETDLRRPLRAGASDRSLAALIRETVRRKWPGHRIDHPDFVRPDRSMSAIGG